MVLTKKYFSKFEGFAIISLLALSAFIYYRDTFNFWFLIDDPAAILYSFQSIKKIFFSNFYSYAFYTPLVALSFKPDVLLFGLNPVAYHIHNTIVLILVSFMVYRILRLYTGLFESFIPSLIVLFSTPSLICVSWIVLRQYLYPMLFSLLAVFLFLKYRPDFKSNKYLVILIMILNELSFMGKEQYMTLPFVLFIISEGNLKERISKTYPYFIVLLFHFVLRVYVLGGVGGYLGGEYLNYNPFDYAKIILKSAFTISKIFFGSYWFTLLFLIPFLNRPKKIILSVGVWIFSLIVSFLVMMSEPFLAEYRYWFIPTVLFSFMIGFSVYDIKRLYLKSVIFLLTLIFFFVNTLSINKELKSSVKNEAKLSEIVSKLLVDDRYKDGLILYPDNLSILASGYVTSMSRVYSRFGLSPLQKFVPIQILAFYPQTVNGKKVYEIQESFNVIDVTNSINEKIKKIKADLTKDKLKVDLIKEKRILLLECNSGKAIIAFSISLENGLVYYNVLIAPYLKSIDLKPFFKDNPVELISGQHLNYSIGQWHIRMNPLKEKETIIMFSCFNEENRLSPLADNALFFKEYSK